LVDFFRSENSGTYVNDRKPDTLTLKHIGDSEMLLLKKDAVDLFVGLAFRSASGWSDDKFLKKIREFAVSEAYAGVEVSEDLVEDEGRRNELNLLLESIRDCGGEVQLVYEDELPEPDDDDGEEVEVEDVEEVAKESEENNDPDLLAEEAKEEAQGSQVEDEEDWDWAEEEDEKEKEKKKPEPEKKPKKGKRRGRKPKTEKPEEPVEQEPDPVAESEEEQEEKPKKAKKPKSKTDHRQRRRRGEIGPDVGSPEGIVSRKNRLFWAGVLLRKRGLEHGITDELVEELDELCGIPNKSASANQLGLAWHVINGYVNG